MCLCEGPGFFIPNSPEAHPKGLHTVAQIGPARLRQQGQQSRAGLGPPSTFMTPPPPLSLFQKQPASNLGVQRQKLWLPCSPGETPSFPLESMFNPVRKPSCNTALLKQTVHSNMLLYKVTDFFFLFFLPSPLSNNMLHFILSQRQTCTHALNFLNTITFTIRPF